MAKKKSFLEKYFRQPIQQVVLRPKHDEPIDYSLWDADETGTASTTYRKSSTANDDYPHYQILVCTEYGEKYYPGREGHAVAFTKYYGPPLRNLSTLHRKGNFQLHVPWEEYIAEVHEPRKHSASLKKPMKTEELEDFHKDFSFQLEDFPDKTMLAVIKADMECLYSEALEKLPQDWENYKKSSQSEK
ncbi:MAG: hypothetical protein MUP55_01135 [Candidatus Aenigmarchaeota archaeon]|nr:hypothetical protein [Candidatus Aenigmarchaeota archaeon]